MPRPPSKHGLERKFKPWRKGKSKTSKCKGSLKQQLRGAERLLAKVSSEEADAERRNELQARIQQLKSEIDQKTRVEKERRNAKESHGLRFLERQRLTRAERSIRKLWAAASASAETTTDDDTKRYEAELQRIALDQVYVAHFPHDVKYVPLFRNGVRIVDENKKLIKRATTRRRILHNLTVADGDRNRVKWIPADQYERLPKEWTVELEQTTFAAAPSNKGDTDDAAATESNDTRFATSAMSQHAALLEAAEQAEAAIQRQEKQEQQRRDSLLGDGSDDDADQVTASHQDVVKQGGVFDESSSSSSSDSSSDDDADPLIASRPETVHRQVDTSKSSSSSESSDSSSGSETETTVSHSNKRTPVGESSNSSDDSDDDSDTESSDPDAAGVDNEATESVSQKRFAETQTNDGAEDFDDFLMPASSDKVNVFEKARQDPGYDRSRPDKSKGWATQRQRPGQFKRRRVR